MRVLACLLTLAVTSPVLAADVRQVILSAPPATCDGRPHDLAIWTAPQAITVRRVSTWIGTNGGNPFPAVDTYTTVFGAGIVLSFYGLDHYVPFTGSHQWTEAFTAEQAPTIAAGQTITVQHLCNPVAGIPSASHTSVIVNYTVN